MMHLEGIIVPLVTPLAGGTVNEDATARLVDFLVSFNVHGVFVSGTTGEGPLLSMQERRRLIQVARRAAGARVPVLAGVGTVSTEESRNMCDMAADEGADGVVIVTPHFYTLSQTELRAHMEALIAHSRLPVVLYDIPHRTGNRLSVDTVAALMKDPKVVCIKDSSGDLAHFQRLLRAARPDATVLMGDDALILPALAVGGHGAVSGLANVIPDVIVSLYSHARSGEYSQARVLQQRVVKAQRAILGESSIIAALKAALAMRGFPAGDPKPPIAPLSAEAGARLMKALREADVLSE